MKHSFLLLLSFFISLSMFGSKNQLDSLLNELDQTIKNRTQFNKIKELQIDSLKTKLTQNLNLENSYNIYHSLYKEYRNYNMDSALFMATKKYDIALGLENTQYQYTAKMNIAEILGIMGMYKEAFDIADEIDRNRLNKDQLPYIYHFYHSTYSLLFGNSLSQKEKKHYEHLVSLYKDSLLQVNDPQTVTYHLIKNGKLIELGRYKDALSIMTDRYRENQNNESIAGSLAYGLSEIYEKLGNIEEQKKYLTISAISDIRRAVKSYISLRKLAVILYKEGDLDRAYLYIKCSMEDATFCKARFRTLEISETLPIIVAAYDKKVTQEKDNLKKYLALISILSIVLIISLIYIYKQLRKLSQARKRIKDMYEKVKHMNTHLNELNKKLSESNLVKEEYIGYVFHLCSSYIDKMETYRININRKLKAGKIDEALKTTNSGSLVSDELKEFFRNFDVIFLNLYPNFVEEFNALFRDDEHIIPKSEDILTPELRVFALIRLGINDSSKIANFLHYSPQTVYNYKLKVHNKLAVSKEDFASLIQKIGK
ncbi:hypothetical protein JGH11_05365 [Dysgonomonas sp. Marseille-P4677]|uniref:DUF6377 domain-containing protein n=1 Tax=Dysgonomonas sp. Marseille-P4677 TaxID=2364790 RepID=UPI0019129256|nr:DUF6377 domain-containing protein [Dysgonomonas sp. Marseille-P4677]MBK5720292.1 hypothetical protein [Dysgonomonas sp. Marseille-P4677]